MNQQTELASYRQTKQAIDAAYPRGWFVAVMEQQILAAAADFHELEDKLRAQGKDPRNVLVVEAGVDYPEYVTIFV
jgi:hypothetical protein